MDKIYFGYLFSAVPLGSIQELPAKSCAEIKASEGKEMAEGKRWIYSDENADQAIQASCHGTKLHFNISPVTFTSKKFDFHKTMFNT